MHCNATRFELADLLFYVFHFRIFNHDKEQFWTHRRFSQDSKDLKCQMCGSQRQEVELGGKEVNSSLQRYVTEMLTPHYPEYHEL